MSLTVSELWLPNVSSSLKHWFALGVFAEMDPARSEQVGTLNNYDSFQNFIGEVQHLLPSFPSLEDYVPEPDWGDIKVYSRGTLVKLFYGNVIEQVPDFVDAFSLTYGRTASAEEDLHAALRVQDFLINEIDRSLVGSAQDVSPGHIEIPGEAFWRDAGPYCWSRHQWWMLRLPPVLPSPLFRVHSVDRLDSLSLPKRQWLAPRCRASRSTSVEIDSHCRPGMPWQR